MTPRIERITRDFVQVSFPGSQVRQFFYLRREGSTWTLSRARGLERPPMLWDGFTTQRAAVAFAGGALAKELTSVSP